LNQAVDGVLKQAASWRQVAEESKGRCARRGNFSTMRLALRHSRQPRQRRSAARFAVIVAIVDEDGEHQVRYSECFSLDCRLQKQINRSVNHEFLEESNY